MEKVSVTLATRISEAEAAILDLEARLQDIIEERRALLGAEALDLKSTARLGSCEQKITATIATQRDRITLLHDQMDVAEHSEAEQRIIDIENEYQLLALSLTPLHEEWIEGLARLATIFADAQAGKAKLQLLKDEGSYLVEKFGTRWPQLQPVPVPARDDVTRALEEPFRKGAWHIHHTSEWKERADAIRQKRNVAASSGVDLRRVSTQRMVRMSTPAFVAGPKV